MKVISKTKKQRIYHLVLLIIFIIYCSFLWFPKSNFLYRDDDIPLILIEAKRTEQKPSITRPFKNSELFDYFAYSYGAFHSFIKISEIKFFKGTGVIHTEQNHRYFIIIINLMIMVGIIFVLSRIIRFDWAIYSIFWLVSLPTEASGIKLGVVLNFFFLISIIASGLLWLKTKNQKYLALMYLSLGLDIINNSLFFTDIFIVLSIVFFYSLNATGFKLKVFKEFIINTYQTLKSFWILIPIIAYSGILFFTKHYADFLQSAYYKYTGMIIHNAIKSENSPNFGFYGHDVIANVPCQVGIPLFAISILTLIVFIFRKKIKPLHWILLAVFIAFLLPMLFYYDIVWLGTPNKYMLFIIPGIVLTGIMYAQLVDRLRFKIIYLIIPLILTIPYVFGAVWNIKPFNNLYKNAPNLSLYGQWRENNGTKSIAWFIRENNILTSQVYSQESGGTELFYFGGYTKKITSKTHFSDQITKGQNVYLLELLNDKDEIVNIRKNLIKKYQLFEGVKVIDGDQIIARIWTNDSKYQSFTLNLKETDQKYNQKYLVYEK